ncbi:MAG: hypothetical protein LBT75_00855, partial [Bacilli bacterium]|nr:hypothetical protein [Bacilli bacterium]
IKDEEFIATKEDAQPINDINLDLLTKPVEGNTEIINLTSGIDLEVINDSEKTKVKNDIFKSFDESLLNGNDAIKAEDSLSKTAIDLKVAKALGETKIDKEDLGKIKKEKVVNIIFMILIIALLCYLGYLIFRFVQGQ